MSIFKRLARIRSLYLQSLKPWNAEGFFDNYVYRPWGFVLALGARRLGLSPNAVSVASLLVGIAAASVIAAGSPGAVFAGAMICQLSLAFDCADGQLARMTRRHSRFGRIFDGLVDLLSILAAYYASFLVLARTGRILDAALLVGAGLVAHILCAVVYDGFQLRYAAALSGEYGDPDELLFADAMVRTAKGFQRFVYSVYRLYCLSQFDSLRKAGEAMRGIDLLPGFKPAFVRANRPILGVWSFIGPSAHIFYFLVFATIGELRLYFLFDFTVLVAALGLLLAAQALVDRGLWMRLHRRAIPNASKPVES